MGAIGATETVTARFHLCVQSGRHPRLIFWTSLHRRQPHRSLAPGLRSRQALYRSHSRVRGATHTRRMPQARQAAVVQALTSISWTIRRLLRSRAGGTCLVLESGARLSAW